ncbi:ABC transporter ATP-binding protein [Robinsoniella sp. KNHs210]|uniref:ABC transporter ATP-binding protein n=1 Tax=Robinsoniella sp. KNHs210 TaxID=1469950 RepID=UPI000695068F|nr:ABC transporter ATP-binding protein [Robinsoniella sp. KNHs210]
MEDCLSVNGLCKAYGKKKIVKSLEFQVKQGQVLAFLGPNGAGKSTTMNMIGTLLAKTDGKIYIDNKDMDTDKNEIKRKIGMVFQEDVLDGDLTIYQNLWFRGGLYWKRDSELKKQIGELIHLLDMEKIQNQKYRECSGGQRRLAQIARALISKPRLLILDEPTTGLDPVTRQNVWDVLLKLKEQLQMTIFYTTHYLDEASYADTLCILKDGKIAACGSLRQIQSKWKNSLKTPDLDEIYFQLLKGEAL